MITQPEFNILRMSLTMEMIYGSNEWEKAWLKSAQSPTVKERELLGDEMDSAGTTCKSTRITEVYECTHRCSCKFS